MNDQKRQLGMKIGLAVAMNNQEQRKKTRKGMSFLHFAFLGLSLLSIPVSAAPWTYDFAQGLDPLFWTTENIGNTAFTYTPTAEGLKVAGGTGGSGFQAGRIMLNLESYPGGLTNFDAVVTFTNAAFTAGALHQVQFEINCPPQFICVVKDLDDFHVYRDPPRTEANKTYSNATHGTMRIVRSGTSISAYLNGSPSPFWSETYNTAPLVYFALALNKNSTSVATEVTWTDFSIDPAPVPNPPLWSPDILPTNLVFRWRGEGDATDAMGVLHGTPMGGESYPAAKVGLGFLFDSNDDRVDIPHHDALNPGAGGFSVQFWMRGTKAQPAYFSALLDKSHGFVDSTGWALHAWTADGHVSFAIGQGGGGGGNFNEVLSKTDVLDGEFHLVTAIWTGAQAQLFVDGVLEDAKSWGPPANNTRPFRLGYAWGGGTPQRFFRGALDEVMVFSRALTPQEVASVYIAQGGPLRLGIQSITNGARLSWPTIAADTILQSCTDLEIGNWEAIADPAIVWMGTSSTVWMPLADARRFYRFVVQAPSYLVVDLSGGPSAASYPVSFLADVPPGGWTDEHKTTKLVLRRLPADAFTMGSPADELGRFSFETQHPVTLTKDFYLGVFEVTQRQWELVMGNKPSYFNNATHYQTRPVEQVSYYDIRENPANSDDPAVDWPNNTTVNASSFMGKLRAKTGLTGFDLPTESQWEHACRADTGTALNSGKNLTAIDVCPNMAELGRYWANGGSAYSQGGDTNGGTANAGSYLPNAWGLYDMHGNVYEWCLDWYGAYPDSAQDPLGAASGTTRVLKGGGWRDSARGCRSAIRGYYTPGNRYDYPGWFGFRAAMTVP